MISKENMKFNQRLLTIQCLLVIIQIENLIRGSKGFDRLKENGEAIRMQCVKWQIKNKR